MSVTDSPPGIVEASRLYRYGIGVLSVAIAVAVRLAIDPLVGSSHVLFAFTLAVMVAAHVGGRGPGLLAAAVSVPAAWYFLIEPRFSFAIADRGEVGSLVLLGAAGACISLLIGKKPRSPHPGREPDSDRSFLWRTVLFGSAFLVLVVFTRLLYADFARDIHHQQWVKRSYEVLDAMRALMSNLQEPKQGSVATCSQAMRTTSSPSSRLLERSSQSGRRYAG